MSEAQQRPGWEKGIGPDLAKESETFYSCYVFCLLWVLSLGVGDGKERVLGQSRLGSMAVEKSSEPEARMKRRDGHAMTFEGVYNASILDYPTHRVRKPFVGWVVVESFWKSSLCMARGEYQGGRSKSHSICFFKLGTGEKGIIF